MYNKEIIEEIMTIVILTANTEYLVRVSYLLSTSHILFQFSLYNNRNSKVVSFIFYE